jgi:hypothetical protein
VPKPCAFGNWCLQVGSSFTKLVAPKFGLISFNVIYPVQRLLYLHDYQPNLVICLIHQVVHFPSNFARQESLAIPKSPTYSITVGVPCVPEGNVAKNICLKRYGGFRTSTRETCGHDFDYSVGNFSLERSIIKKTFGIIQSDVAVLKSCKQYKKKRSAKLKTYSCIKCSPSDAIVDYTVEIYLSPLN